MDHPDLVDGSSGLIHLFLNSRNRIFVKDESTGFMRTQAFDESKVTDPRLIIYYPARHFDNAHIITNGDQTDTIYDAIKAGKALVAQGKKFGVRLDSGDIHYLSVEVRKALDQAGLTEATIAVSNDLDESIIQTLVAAGAPIDSWGVGT